MDDLISKEVAIHTVFSMCCRWNTDDPNDLKNMLMTAFQELPSAQPEIIRCKDCKHWGIHKRLNIPWCREMHIDRGADDFCSDGEKKGDKK